MDHHAFIVEMKEPVLPKPDLVILKGVSITYIIFWVLILVLAWFAPNSEKQSCLAEKNIKGFCFQNAGRTM